MMIARRKSNRGYFEESHLIAREPCPACQEKGGDTSGDNLARYSDGHGYCHACGYYEHGDGSSRPATTDPERKRIMSELNLTGEVMALRTRGITEETCAKFSYTVGKHNGKWVQIAPYYDDHGRLCAQHLRFENKDFIWLGDAKKALLFGQQLWPHGGKRVVVTEGEIDTLTISQLQGNKWPVVSIWSGAGGAVKAIKRSLEWLESFNEVIFCFDMDEPGQEAALECAAILSPGKAKIAKLPCKDANECLLQGKSKELLSALWDAKVYRPDGIVSGKELWDKVRVRPTEGMSIPYPQLSEKIMGVRPGELYLFTAGSGIGKSTLVNEIAYHLKMEHGQPLGIMALEESVVRNALRYIGIYLNRPVHLPHIYDSVPEEEMKAAFDAVVGDDRWYIYDHFGSTEVEGLISKIRYMVVGLGVKVLVLDHISIVVSGLDEIAESERKSIDRLMTALRSLIQETGVTVLAVVHLKRPDKGKSYNEGRQVSLTDLRGSGSLEQLSDVVIALERNQQGEDPNKANIRILKNRPVGITGPAGQVRYNPETGRLLHWQEEEEAATFGFTATTPEEQEEVKYGF
jgi:twinkle protein